MAWSLILARIGEITDVTGTGELGVGERPRSWRVRRMCFFHQGAFFEWNRARTTGLVAHRLLRGVLAVYVPEGASDEPH